jgi:crotonobetainyl-CoA:carnitine CoA-transferase CaiB-like acyl-CoA transferase
MPEYAAEKPPLHGVRVIDLSRVLAGPYASMLLADLGADVIKVERPETGDDTRAWGPPFVGPADAKESTYFLSVNRSKRSLVSDLKDPEDSALLRDLIADADVVIENFRHGVMDRLGLSHDRLLELNPRLIVLSITGFGANGPESGRVGYDQILQAEGGLMSLTGTSGFPTKVGVPIADLMAGTYGALGVVAALRAREEDGRGQVVHTSLLAGQVGIHCFQGTRWLVAGEIPSSSGNQHPTVCPYGMFDTATVPIVIAVGNDAIWQRFAPLVGLAPDDPGFATNSDRIEQRERVEALIGERFSQRPATVWLEDLTRNGVPAGEVRTLDRVYEWDQLREQDLVMSVEHASLGTLELPGSPLRFSRSPAPSPTAPPTLGQHTDAIIAERSSGIA